MGPSYYRASYTLPAPGTPPVWVLYDTTVVASSVAASRPGAPTHSLTPCSCSRGPPERGLAGEYLAVGVSAVRPPQGTLWRERDLDYSAKTGVPGSSASGKGAASAGLKDIEVSLIQYCTVLLSEGYVSPLILFFQVLHQGREKKLLHGSLLAVGLPACSLSASLCPLSLPSAPPLQVSFVSPGLYQVTVLAVRTGTYTLLVSLGKTQIANGNLTVSVGPGLASASASYITGLGARYSRAGTPGGRGRSSRCTSGTQRERPRAVVCRGPCRPK